MRMLEGLDVCFRSWNFKNASWRARILSRFSLLRSRWNNSCRGWEAFESRPRHEINGRLFSSTKQKRSASALHNPLLVSSLHSFFLAVSLVFLSLLSLLIHFILQSLSRFSPNKVGWSSRHQSMCSLSNLHIFAFVCAFVKSSRIKHRVLSPNVTGCSSERGFPRSMFFFL